MVGLTRALSRKLAPAVLVNAIAPGVIETKMAEPVIAERGDAYRREIPLKRFGLTVGGGLGHSISVLARRVLYHRTNDHDRWRDNQRLRRGFSIDGETNAVICGPNRIRVVP